MSDKAAQSFGPALHCTVTEQLEAALNALQHARDRHAAVHAARKAIRRIRGSLALGDKVFGAQITPIDAELRRLAKSLSRLRDAHGVVGAAKRLTKCADTEAWKTIVLLLQKRRDQLLKETLQRDKAFTKRRRRLTKITAAINDLPWDRVSKHDVYVTVDRSIRRSEKAHAKSRLSPTGPNLHRWRRRVRRVRIQFEILKSMEKSAGIRSDHSKRHKLSIHSLKHLADRLGWMQDLYVLRSSLKGLVTPSAATKLRADIQREIKLR